MSMIICGKAKILFFIDSISESATINLLGQGYYSVHTLSAYVRNGRHKIYNGRKKLKLSGTVAVKRLMVAILGGIL